MFLSTYSHLIDSVGLEALGSEGNEILLLLLLELNSSPLLGAGVGAFSPDGVPSPLIIHAGETGHIGV